MSVAGVIFSNIHDETIPEITRQRTIGSVPFGCRYRLVDFSLSNMVNAGIENIGIITNHNYQSLLDHIGTGKDWDLARRKGGIKILPPYITSFDQPIELKINAHRLESLKGVSPFFKDLKDDYIVFSDCDSICNIDLKKIIDTHKETEADLTIVVKDLYVQGYEGKNLTIVDSDAHGNVTSVRPSGTLQKGFYNVSINVMVFTKKYIVDLLAEAKSAGYVSFREQLIPARIGKDKIKIYKYDSYYSAINSLRDYYTCNMDLLKTDVRHALFDVPNRPVLTRIKNSPPTYYAKGSRVVNSLIADGCRIEGTVENSIIFRGVHIEEGVTVKNSILMPNTTLLENCFVNCLIADKNVVIREGRMLSGHETRPFYLEKNAVI